jgi:hypothetical protein
MDENPIPDAYRGWWRITDTSMWGSTELDILGDALISFTGSEDRLRMFVLLAKVKCKPIRSGISFTWKGAWEWDQLTGSGSLKLSADGKLQGIFKIKHGDESTLTLERAEPPLYPIPDPPRYEDKWRRRRF